MCAHESNTQIVAFVRPFHRMFFINDLNISFPHAEVERVSVSASSVPLFLEQTIEDAWLLH